MSRDDHVAFGLVIVAHALHAVDLGQLVDDLPMLSVHRRETVAPLRLLSLISKLYKILDLLFHLCDKLHVFSGILFEAVAVRRGGANVEGVRRRVDLQRLRQAPVPLQSGALLIALEPRLFQLFLRDQRADIHGVTELHVRKLTGHGNGSIPLV